MKGWFCSVGCCCTRLFNAVHGSCLSKTVGRVCLLSYSLTHSVFPAFCLSSWRHPHSLSSSLRLFLMCAPFLTTSIYCSERYQADIKRGRERASEHTLPTKKSSWKQYLHTCPTVCLSIWKYNNSQPRRGYSCLVCVYFIFMFALHVDQRKPHYTTLLVQFKVQLDRCVCARGEMF